MCSQKDCTWLLCDTRLVTFISLYYTASMAQQKKKNQAGIAVAIWILIALVLLIVFLIKQDDILRTLKDTGFFRHTIGTEPEFVANYKSEPNAETEDEPIQMVVQNDLPPVVEETSSQQVSQQGTNEETVSGQEVQPEVPVIQVESAPVSAITDDKPTIPMTNAKLFFVVIGGDGSVSRKECIRSFQKTNSPLTSALNALLTGPSLDELNDGCMTLIPEGSRLLSASVKDKVATLNFSEEFEFNRYGVEGYIGQLMQVVYTATAFPTVESVQFLVEGQRKEYIGSEGVWIGSPLSTTSFK